MDAARFVLRYGGDGPAPATEVARVAEQAGVHVVDRSDRMLLVEADPATIEAVVARLPAWTFGPERTYWIPEPGSPPHAT